ncbi:unnamed protein product [Adineta ricciae]|uniref:Uncharacterized protein n=1 Tax=Adineta ricciae TaxID=249248 RepID=A0A813RIL2_ADIRI|nr:unnamed protein product [Adineta ricciae]
MAIRQKLLTSLSSRANETEKVIDVQNERLMDEAFARSFATVCTIFGNAQCDEFVYPEYLSRFYYVIQQGLRFYHGDEQRSQAIIESILLNSGDLFRINLRGVNILIPLFLDAIEYYLHIDLQSYINYNLGIVKGPLNTSNSTIRDRFIRIRSKSIHILMSIISLPFHYQHLEQHLFEDYLEKSHDVQTATVKTFLEYRLRIFPLLFSALQTEIDITNAQLLFGTIRLACSLAAHLDREQEHNGDSTKKDPTAGYVSHAVNLICEKGTNDSQLFLAALDTLISIATDPICQIPIDTWKNVLKRLCTFVDTQLHRSPKDHTREMHSTCVATYNTLITLIIERPMLLDDYENLYKLCEIIELGISGEKAQSADGLVSKKDKEFHPASQRVAEAAEYLMFILFEHKAVLHLKDDICRNWLDESIFTNTTFKYFAINGNTLFAMSELPITDNHGMQAIVLLYRGLFGKNVWTSKFRHNPLSNPLLQPNKSIERFEHENGKNTSPPTPNMNSDYKHRPLPLHGTKTERAKSEFSIPTLNSIIQRDEDKLNSFRALKTKQISIEEQAIERAYLSNETTQPGCKPPECQKHFESIRLFLSHYGFCSLDAMHHLMNAKQWNDSKLFGRLQPRIQLLNSQTDTFMDDIRKLDHISPTLHCTGQVYYLKKHQATLLESSSNLKTPDELNPAFLTMFSQFGSVVEVKRHCGWTGNAATSWKTIASAQSETNAASKVLAEIDGEDSILYWLDLTSEMAFFLPHHFSVDHQSSEMRILIVWLEEFRDDLDSILPAQESSTKARDICIIGIHPLKTHLFRILLNSSAQRMQSACASIPLLDGMVIPLHLLSFYLRQAVYNLSRRKRLEDSQSSQTTYLLRKTRISKIIEKYQHQINHLDEFFQNIFFLSTNKSEHLTESLTDRNSVLDVEL